MAKSAFRRYWDARSRPGKDFAPNSVAEMQSAMLDALRAGDPLPDDMRLHLVYAFENVCAGFSDPLLTPVKRPGGREPPIAKRTHEDGIRYLRWCEDGRIADASPVSTVAAAYRVHPRTVRGWRTAWHDQPTPPLPEDYGAEQVAEFMRISGKAYRSFIKKPEAKRKA